MQEATKWDGKFMLNRLYSCFHTYIIHKSWHVLSMELNTVGQVNEHCILGSNDIMSYLILAMLERLEFLVVKFKWHTPLEQNYIIWMYIYIYIYDAYHVAGTWCLHMKNDCYFEFGIICDYPL